MKNIVLLELNEINFDAVSFYIERGEYLPGFKKLFEKGSAPTLSNLAEMDSLWREVKQEEK